MAEFPQNEWIEVNERLVPLTKPQHYKKGSTTEVELTGHDNPLPTADYGMTESGLWIPKRVSDDGAVHTQVTGSNVEYFDLQESIGSIPAGTSREVRSPGDGSASFRDVNAHKEFTKLSIFIRRQAGNFEDVSIIFGGVDAAGSFPSVSLDKFGSDGVIVVTEKKELLTNDFSISVKASADADLELRNLRLYLWKE